jgi:hypothetical protein
LHFLELLYNLVGAFFELLFRLLAASFAPLRGRVTSPGTDILPREISLSLPQGTLHDIASALKADEDAAAHLPRHWRGYYIGLCDEPLPEAADRVPIGSEVRLVSEPINPGRQDAVRVVAHLPDRSTVQLGYLGDDHQLGESVELGRVRSWFAGRMRTVVRPATAMIFAAEYDPGS